MKAAGTSLVTRSGFNIKFIFNLKYNVITMHIISEHDFQYRGDMFLRFGSFGRYTKLRIFQTLFIAM